MAALTIGVDDWTAAGLKPAAGRRLTFRPVALDAAGARLVSGRPWTVTLDAAGAAATALPAAAAGTGVEITANVDRWEPVTVASYPATVTLTELLRQHTVDPTSLAPAPAPAAWWAAQEQLQAQVTALAAGVSVPVTVQSRPPAPEDDGVLWVANLPSGALPLIDPATPADAQPVGFTEGFELTASDEMLHGYVDRAKWGTRYPETARWAATVPGGWYTNSGEKQAYLAGNISHDSDGAVFELRREPNVVDGLELTSGMLQGRDVLHFTGGFVEVRAACPVAGGTWSAFWLMDVAELWQFEVDIFEHYDGSPTGVNSGFIWPGVDEQRFPVALDPSVPHTYGCHWRLPEGADPGFVRLYVDGALVGGTTNDVPTTAMYPILNMAQWRDRSVADTPMPQQSRWSRFRLFKEMA